MRSAPPEAAVARFKADLSRLIDVGDAPLGVAVSGGADSLALLLLTHAAFPDRTRAATVDHGLRPESAREAAYVAEVCASLSVPHQVLTVGEKPVGNVSDWARTVRYLALEAWARREGLIAYTTAHHADDQLETLVMRLNRGSGAAGLAGIRAKRGTLLRPLLGWRADELAAVVAAADLQPVDDPTNYDDRFDRARLRKALQGAAWLDPLAASQSASALADADVALDYATDVLAADRIVVATGEAILRPADLPLELRRRLVRRCLVAIVPDANPRGDALTRLIEQLSAGATTTLAGVLCSGGESWRFAPAPPRRKI